MPKLLVLGGFLHFGFFCLLRRRRGGGGTEDAGHAALFEFGDGAFEDVAEDIDVDFITEIIVADALKDGGPRFIREVEVVDGGVFGEEAAVVAVIKFECRGVPCRFRGKGRRNSASVIFDFVKGRDLLVGCV